jgi:hypothetical protein
MAKVNYTVNFGRDFYSSNAQNFTITGIIEVADDVGEYNSIGQKVLSGAYPQADNEVVISDYFAALLQKYGAYYKESMDNIFGKFEGTESDPYAGLIGKEILTNYGYIKVCGVYETDYRRFVDDELAFRGYNAEEFDFKLEYVYSVLHANKNYISSYAEAHPTTGGLVAIFGKTNNNNISIRTTDLKATAINSSSITSSVYYAQGKTVDNVISKNIVISVSLYNEIFTGLGYPQLVDANLNASTKTVDFGIEEGVSLDIDITLNNHEKVTYTIVGVYKDGPGSNIYEVLLGQDRYRKDFIERTTFSTNTKVLYMSVGNSTIEKVINILDAEGFTFVSTNSQEISNYGDRLGVMKSAFLIASIFMAIYSLVLMYYFISQMIVDKKNDIGVLKTLGCGKGDIAGIFVLCGASLAFIIFLVTILLSFVIAAISNIIVVSQIPVTISVFTTSGLMYLWIAFICIAVVALGTFLPISKYSKMPPKELMKIF